MLEREDLDDICRDPETDAEDESVPQDDVVPSDAEDEAASQNETLEDIDNKREIVEGGEYCIKCRPHVWSSTKCPQRLQSIDEDE
jgi:hypothetical protein